MQGGFQALLWADQSQNEVCPWQLYETLRKCRAYFKLCCGQAEVRMRSAHGSLYEILRKSMDYFKLCCGQAEVRMRSAHGSFI